MQDLYAERMQLFDRLMDELQALRNSGSQYLSIVDICSCG